MEADDMNGPGPGLRRGKKNGLHVRKLHIFTTGGTIDKVYFDALSAFQVGDTVLGVILHEANVALHYEVTPLMRKDSLDLTDVDRARICTAVKTCSATAVLVTHGTDTMTRSASLFTGESDKTIVFTGAMQPASQRFTDAIFNIGFAVAASQVLPPGVYIAMNGRIFDPKTATKDRANQRFVQRAD